MDSASHSRLVSLIWSIADDVLRDLFKRGKYPDVILPMCVLRRLDAVLEPTRQAVRDQHAFLTANGFAPENQGGPLRTAARQAFYNTSRFRLSDLTTTNQSQQLEADFKAYLDGFSPNIIEIIDKFKFRNQLDTLSRVDALAQLVARFTTPDVDLSPQTVDNHAMGTIFEELVRRFNEENNEEAGEHWTPRDAVRLMAELTFRPVAASIMSGTYTIYDGACGTGGMLTVADETLAAIAAGRGQQVSTRLFGQEINPETYAVCTADMILKGSGEDAANIRDQSTLADDGFRAQRFDFMLSNPPYGKSWKRDLEQMGGKDGMTDHRFKVVHRGEELSFVTRSSDGQLLFLANLVAKMRTDTPTGSRVAEVHNGSSLFTGDAGSGESNIRRYVIENDWLEAIIALPTNLFYNTGIATYVWVLASKKAQERKGKVQLIDATAWSKPLRKNLGSKNCELGTDDIERVTAAFLTMEESAQSKVFPNEAFGYWKVVVDRPLRLRGRLSAEAITALRTDSGDAELREPLLAFFGDALANDFGRVQPRLVKWLDDWSPDDASTSDDDDGPARGVPASRRKKLLDPRTWERDHRLVRAATALRAKVGDTEFVDHAAFKRALELASVNVRPIPSAADIKAILEEATWRDETCAPVIAKDLGARGVADPLHGRFSATVNGKRTVVEYAHDAELRDTEQVPLLEEGGIAGFLAREVLPYAPDAWFNPASVKVGYEISFNRHFYAPPVMRTLEEIGRDIADAEREASAQLASLLQGVTR